MKPEIVRYHADVVSSCDAGGFIRYEDYCRLEIENNKLSELFDAAGVDNNILHERIKAFETSAEDDTRLAEANIRRLQTETSEANLLTRNELTEKVLKLLSELFDAMKVDNNNLTAELARCREMYRSDA